MPVHPAFQPYLDAMAAAAVAAVDAPPTSADERIALLRTSVAAFGQLGAGEPEPMHSVQDLLADGPHGPIPLRIYTPAPGGALPVVVYFHGGGFVCGSIDSWDTVCRRIAKESGAAVASVDYRLAPEHPFPIPLDDCHAAVAWVAAHAEELGLDGTRVTVAGDSAGGNLSAAIALRARVEGPPLRAQVLVYPVVNPACSTASMTSNGTGYLLTADAMREMWAWYLGSDGDHDAFAAVDTAADYTGVPPALILTAEYDPLRDEGEHFASLLDGFGVETRLVRYDGMIHGFLNMREIVPESDQAITEIAEFVRAHL